MTTPVQGDVWRYDYLWRWQHEAGETEGRKSRPVSFVAVVSDKYGKTNLFILPITSLHPAPHRIALEIPQIEQRRAGLDDNKPLWIMLDEYNHDIMGQSYYFNPNAKIGSFSAAFHKKVLKTFVSLARDKKLKRVPRV
jgi:hypothetical protein